MYTQREVNLIGQFVCGPWPQEWANSINGYSLVSVSGLMNIQSCCLMNIHTGESMAIALYCNIRGLAHLLCTKYKHTTMHTTMILVHNTVCMYVIT